MSGKEAGARIGDEAWLISSAAVRDDFRIDISLPEGYYKSKGKYPVVYLLDSNLFFKMVAGIAQFFQFGNVVPPIIIVGIGYSVEREHMKLRDRDYLPTHHPVSELSGGADNFLAFLTDELQPFIEDRYRVIRDDCVLAGDSYSGLFALYALFQKPEAFKKYIIGSPSIYWDQEVILDCEEEFAAKNDELKARVFLSVGELEAISEPAFAKMVSNVETIYEKLISRQYRGLELEKHIFEGETHLSVIPATMSRGLNVVFEECVRRSDEC